MIAEGVETQEQARFLRHGDVDYARKYDFSPPLPADGFRKYGDRHRTSGTTALSDVK